MSAIICHRTDEGELQGAFSWELPEILMLSDVLIRRAELAEVKTKV